MPFACVLQSQRKSTEEAQNEGEQRHEQKRGLRLCTREKSLQAGELQLAGVRAQQPSSHGVDAFEQRGLCLSSEGSATGESAGVCLACNPKNASLPLKLKGH